MHAGSGPRSSRRPADDRQRPALDRVVAGGLATLNPCGFPLLPAYLSFYVGADEERLPSAPSRLLQGLLAGLLVTEKHPAAQLRVYAIWTPVLLTDERSSRLSAAE